MSVRFIVGRAGSGKTYACLSEIQKQLEVSPLGSPLIMIVPEQASFSYEVQLLSNKIVGSMRAEVLSFGRLFNKLCAEKNYVSLPWLDDVGKSMLLLRILRREANDLRIFNSLARRTGFCNNLLDMINEFARFDVLPDELRNFADMLPESILTSAKLRDLSVLYDGLRDAVGSTYLDENQMFTYLSEEIARSGKLDDAELWIDGFTDFNPLQRKVLAAAFTHCRRVNIALCCDPKILSVQELPEEHLFYNTWHTWHQLNKLAEKVGAHVEPTVLLSDEHRAAVPCLHYLEKFWCGYATPQIADAENETAALMILPANDRYDEVERVARQIIYLCRDEGYRYRDIALMLRDISGYRDIIAEVFSRFNIPCFMDVPRDLRTHPLVELVVSSLEVISSGWSHQAVFRYLKNGLVPLSQAEVDELENYCLQYGVYGSQWYAERPWQHLPAEEEDRQTHIDEMRRRAASPLYEVYGCLNHPTKINDYTKFIFTLTEALKCRDSLALWAKQATDDGDLQNAQVHQMILEALNAVVEQIKNFMGTEKITAEEMSDLLIQGLQTANLETVPPAVDEVFVADLQRSRTPEIAVAFILGANDGLMPARLTDDGLLDSLERQTLAELGLELAASQKQRQLSEEYIIYMALTRAASKVIISYSSNDGESDLKPALFIDRVLQFYPNTPVIMQDDENNIRMLCGGNDTLRELQRRLANVGTVDRLPALWQQVWTWYSANNYWQKITGQIAGMLNYDSGIDNLENDVVLRLYNKLQRTSISRLERFNICPMQYFARYGLNIEPRPQFELRRLDIGSIYHGLLEQTAMQIADWEDVDENRFNELIEAALHIVKLDGSGKILSTNGKNTYAERKIKDVMALTLRNVAEQLNAGSFKPAAFELDFGGAADGLPGLCFSLPNGNQVLLNGKIDRVDRAFDDEGRAYYRIIDYKTGDKNFDLSDVYNGIGWQLPLYLQTVLAAAEDTAMPAGMFYSVVKDGVRLGENEKDAAAQSVPYLKFNGVPILNLAALVLTEKDFLESKASRLTGAKITKDGKLSASAGLSPEDYGVLQRYLAFAVVNTVSKMQSGVVLPQPQQKAGDSDIPCANCDYAAVCALDRDVDHRCAVRVYHKEKAETVLKKMREEVDGDDAKLDE